MNTDSWKGPRKIGVLLGSSSTVYDIESTILDVEAGTPFRWLNIAAGSGNVEDCYRIALLLYSSGLEIDTVVCGVHPDMLARTENFLADHSEADSAQIVKEQPGLSPRTVVRQRWVYCQTPSRIGRSPEHSASITWSGKQPSLFAPGS